MYIKNKKTGLIQECHNKDVIKTCRRDPEHFEVTSEMPLKANSTSASPTIVTKSFDEMTLTELENEAKERGLEGYSSLSKEELLSILKDVVE